MLACVVNRIIIRSQQKFGAIQLHTSPTGVVMGQVHLVTIQPHTSPISGAMGVGSLQLDCCSHGVGSISDHPTTYIHNWWSHGVGTFQLIGWFCTFNWSEPIATNAPIQDEAVQAVLGMNQKHSLFPSPGIFQPLSLPQNFPLLPTSPPPSYLPPPSCLLHLISYSFPTHSISRAQESS